MDCSWINPGAIVACGDVLQRGSGYAFADGGVESCIDQQVGGGQQHRIVL